MMFSVPLAWLVVTACAGVLLLMGKRNKASGWRRERRSITGDVLMTWAVARHADPAGEESAQPQSSPVESLDLIALHSAVGSSTSIPSNPPQPQQNISVAGELSSVESSVRQTGIAVK